MDRRWHGRMLLAFLVCLACPWAVGFAQPPSEKGFLVVKSSAAKVMAGTQAVAEVRQGQRLPFTQHQGDWYLIEVSQDGGTLQGWISAGDVTVETAANVAAGGKVDPATSDKQQMQGTWVCTATVKGGKQVKDYVGVRALIMGDDLTWYYPQPDGKYREQKAKYRLDSTQQPKHFDWWTEDKPDAVEMRIYSVTADELRWATNLDRKTRPATFEAGLWQFTMKRVP